MIATVCAQRFKLESWLGSGLGSGSKLGLGDKSNALDPGIEFKVRVRVKVKVRVRVRGRVLDQVHFALCIVVSIIPTGGVLIVRIAVCRYGSGLKLGLGVPLWEPSGVASWEPSAVALWEPSAVALWEPSAVALGVGPPFRPVRGDSGRGLGFGL